MTIMQDLHQLGETNRHPDRQRGLTGKQQWQAMLAAYERQKLSSGLYPVSLEVNYGHAWGTETPTSLQSVSSSGEVLVDINVLKQRHNPR